MVEAYARAYRNVYQSIASAEMEAPTGYRVPRAHILFSFATSHAAIEVQRILGGSHPRKHVLVDPFTESILSSLRAHVREIATAVYGLVDLEEKEKEKA